MSSEPTELPGRVALVGMSGVGKSHWSQHLEALGFLRWSCDELIAEALGQDASLDLRSTRDLARWMGHPYERRYPEAEATYLRWEERVTETLCERLNTLAPDQKVVIDTTGSFIYLPPEAIDRLRSQVLMIYLSSAPEQDQQMLQTFLEDPKPVIWGGAYQRQPEEAPDVALRRCYPLLLAERRRRYQELAHAVIDLPTQRTSGFDAEKLLHLAQAQQVAQVFS